jgi:hypothetical protein
MQGSSSSLPAAAPLEALEESPHPGYVVSEQLDITYCNQAWDRRALEEGGEAAVLASNIVGRNLLDFVAPDLKSFYTEMFTRARALGQPVSHDYECSSATVFRLYRMQVFPLQPGAGFVVQNSLRVEHPHDRIALQPSSALYKDDSGLIHTCANCRRTRRVTDPGIWDWVPAYVASKSMNISHGVCPMCLEFYYRPSIKDLAA